MERWCNFWISQASTVARFLRKHCQPTNQPTNQPTKQPTNQPTNQPTKQATNQPTNQATKQPSNQATKQPSNQAANPALVKISTAPGTKKHWILADATNPKKNLIRHLASARLAARLKWIVAARLQMSNAQRITKLFRRGT